MEPEEIDQDSGNDLEVRNAKRKDLYRNPVFVVGVAFAAVALILGMVWLNNAQRQDDYLSGMDSFRDSPNSDEFPSSEQQPEESSLGVFPKGIPIVEGNLKYGNAAGDSAGRAWTVTVTSGERPELDAIAERLESSNFFLYGVDTLVGAGGTIARFSNEDYEVIVHIPSVKDGDGAWVTDYEARSGNMRVN